MEQIIVIDKEDIKTSLYGVKIMVKIDEKMSLLFSEEALDELIKDYKEIKTEMPALTDKNIVIPKTEPSDREQTS